MVFNIGKTLDKEFKAWKGKKMTKHTMAQRVALNTFLNEYDESANFEDILAELENSNGYSESITVQEYYEDWPGEKLAESINDLVQSIDRENAAPELLEALERIIEYHVPKINPLLDASILSAQSAINKAKGE